MLAGSSIFTFISNELPALRAHLSNDDIVRVKDFIGDALKLCDSPQAASALGEFLFRNTFSVASKFLQPVLQTAINNPSYLDIQKLQLTSELERLKKARDIDGLVQEWVDKRAAKGKEGIGVVDGKVVFGPKLSGDDEGEDEVPMAPMSYVGLGGLDAMKRVMGKK